MARTLEVSGALEVFLEPTILMPTHQVPGGSGEPCGELSSGDVERLAWSDAEAVTTRTPPKQRARRGTGLLPRIRLDG